MKSSLILASLLSATLGLSAHGAVSTWTGAGGDGDWATAANWSLEAVPSTSDEIWITGTVGSAQTINVSSPSSIAGIVLGGIATVSTLGDSYTLNGNTLTIGQASINVLGQNTWGILANSSRTQTINNDIVFTGANTAIGTGYGKELILNGAISGNGLIIAGYGGRTVLNGANTYTGVTMIARGTLRLGNDAALGSSSYISSTMSDSILDLNGHNVSIGYTLAGGGVITNSADTAVTYSGAISYYSGESLSVDGTGAIDFTKGINNIKMIKRGNNTMTISGGDSNIGTTLVVNGGTAILRKTLYDGALRGKDAAGNVLTINTGGVAILGSDNQIRDGVSDASTGIVAVYGGTFDINSKTETINGLQVGAMNGSTAGSVISTGGAGTLTIQDKGIQATNGTISANLAGASAAFTKTTSGTVTLSGNNTYGGATTVSAGQLNINGSLTQSAVTVNTDGVLGGSGTVTNGVTLAGGTLNGTLTTGTLSGSGIVSPGNSPGILTASSLAAGNSLSFAFELATATPNYASTTASLNDILHITNSASGLSLSSFNNIGIYFSSLSSAALTAGSAFEGTFYVEGLSGVSLLSAFESTNVTYYVIDSDSTVDANDVIFNGVRYVQISNTLIEVTGSDYVTSAFGTGNSASTLEFTLVPEPGTWAMMIGGLGMIVFMRRACRRVN